MIEERVEQLQAKKLNAPRDAHELRQSFKITRDKLMRLGDYRSTTCEIKRATRYPTAVDNRRAVRLY